MDARKGCGNYGCRQRHRASGRSRIGAAQCARDGARGYRREHGCRRLRSQRGGRAASPSPTAAIPPTRRFARRFSIPSVASSIPSPCACRPPALPRRSCGTYRQDHGQGAHLSGGPVQRVMDVNHVAPVYWALEMIGGIPENRAARGLSRWQPSERCKRPSCHRLRFLARQPRPDLLRQRQGWPRGSGRDHREGSHSLRVRYGLIHPGVHRHADGALNRR